MLLSCMLTLKLPDLIEHLNELYLQQQMLKIHSILLYQTKTQIQMYNKQVFPQFNHCIQKRNKQINTNSLFFLHLYYLALQYWFVLTLYHLLAIIYESMNIFLGYMHLLCVHQASFLLLLPFCNILFITKITSSGSNTVFATNHSFVSTNRWSTLPTLGTSIWSQMGSIDGWEYQGNKIKRLQKTKKTALGNY